MTRRSLVALSCLLGSGLVAFGSSSARAQLEPTVVDLGRFSFDTLARVNPSLLYRPFDMVGVRPDARALGMGGAYSALADDPLAVGWNPAGLSAVGEFTLAVDGFHTRTSSTATGYPPSLTIPQAPTLFVTAYDNTYKSGVRYGTISAAVPLFHLGSRSLVGAFSWRRYAGVIQPEETVQDLVLEDTAGFPVTVAADRKERGAVEAFGPSLAMELLPGLSLGSTLNFLDGRSRVNGSVRLNTGGGGSPEPGEEKFTQKYQGLSFDLGARIRVGERIRLAARFTPEHDLEVTGGEYEVVSVVAPGTPATIVTGQLSGYDLAVPSLFSVGVAARPIERLWLTADYVSQKMGDAEVRLTGDPAISYFDSDVDWLTGSVSPPPPAPDPVLATADFEQIAVGAEYVLFRPTWAEIPVRVGFRSTDLPYVTADSADYSYRYLHEEAIADGLPPEFFTRFQTIGIRYNGPHGEQPNGTGFSFGASIRTDRVSYDLGVDVFSFEETRFYQDSIWDPVFNPNPIEGQRILFDEEENPLPPPRTHPDLLSVDRSITTIRFSATYRFPDLF